MKKLLLFSIFSFIMFPALRASMQLNDTTVYLLTCAPGNETYSLWGHSALRVVMPGSDYDKVYNWGVFDFATPHFAWKFAKGRLNYMLGVYGYEAFIKDYFVESRSVISQIVNLTPVEKLRLMILLDENMKPENRYYRYDFLYDNCSSRIRDILEKLLGNKLIYPPDELEQSPTFRDRIGQYTRNSPWTKMGIDLLVGTPADKKTTFRDRMFLPDDLQKNLTRAIINRDRKMFPLLYPAETILDMPATGTKPPLYGTPIFVFTVIFIFLVFLSARFKDRAFMTYMDIALFLVFSVIAILMIFFSFFTDHIETRMNLNILWFNPFILTGLISLITGKRISAWFKVIFWLALVFVPLVIIMPAMINSSFIPVIFILLLRSSARAGFQWNPLSVAPANKE